MKRILLLLLVQVVFASGAVCQQPSGIGPTRSRFTVNGDGFSVLLYSRPALTTARDSLKDGKERTKRLLTTTMNGVDYSIEIFENSKPGQLVPAMKDGKAVSMWIQLEYNFTL